MQEHEVSLALLGFGSEESMEPPDCLVDSAGWSSSVLFPIPWQLFCVQKG